MIFRLNRYLIKSVVITALLSCCSLMVLAQIPPNDLCINAIPLPVTTGTCNSAIYTNVNATISAGDPTPVCWTPSTISNTVWFTFQPTSTSVNISTNFSHSLTNTQLAVFSGTCGVLTQIECQEDINPGLGMFHTSLMINGLSVAATYYIMIDGNTNQTGTFGICVQNVNPPGAIQPSQDCPTATILCDKAPVLIPDGAGSIGTLLEWPSCFGAPGERSSNWFQFTAQTSGTLCFEIAPNTVIDYDFAVFDITNGCLGTQVACNWNNNLTNNGITGLGCPGIQCAPCLNITSGKTYAIIIDRFSPASNSGFTLSFNNSTATFGPPIPSFSNTTVCAGVPTNFTNSSPGSGNQYLWNFGDSTTSSSQNPVHTYITAGNYTVNLTMSTNPGGCQNTVSQPVVVLPTPVVSILPSTTNLCAGNSATVTASGAISYSWSPPTGLNTTTGPVVIATPLVTTTYTVTGFGNGCSSVEYFTLNVSPAITSDFNVNPIACTGIATTVTYTGNGGVGANYIWNFSGATIVSGSGQGPYQIRWSTAGIKTVTLSVIQGSCTTSTSIPVDVILRPTSTFNINPVYCVGQSAFINYTGNASPGAIYNWNFNGGIILSGNGMGPYQVIWTVAGTYNVTLTVGQNGCNSLVTTIPVQINALPVVIISASPASCTGQPATVNFTGVADSSSTFIWNFDGGTIHAGSGSGPYQVSWSNPGLINITLTVTQNGCTQMTSVPVNVMTGGMSTSVIVTNNPCFGGSNGSAIVSTSGGTGPYLYSWSTSPVQTSSIANSLSSGTYTCTVTDQSGCKILTAVNITEPPLLNLGFNITNTTCGSNNGQITLLPSGGTPGYSYLWNLVPPNTSQTVSNLSAGFYSVTVTDSNGCSRFATISVSDNPAGVPSTSIINHVSCPGGFDGSAQASITGGTPPYSYSWNTLPAQSTSIATNMQAGNYTASITDANGCITSQTVTITQPPVLNYSINSLTNVSCFGINDGSATINASGGTPGYTVQWNTNPVQIGFTASSLFAGNYLAFLTDAKGCTLNIPVAITEPTKLTASTTAINVICNGSSTGSASVSVAGGTIPYSISWNSSPPQAGPIVSLIPSGTYISTVTDAMGCITQVPVIVTEPSALTASSTVQGAQCGLANGQASLTPSGGTGPYTYHWNSVPPQNTSGVTNLAAGNYIATITDAMGCQIQIPVQISAQAGSIAVASVINHVSCANGSDGNAQINISGGTSPYTYFWNSTPPQFTSAAGGLSSGTYTATVTDANGCAAFASVVITQPNMLNSTALVVKNVSCWAGNDGSASVSVTGGTPGYTLLWNSVPGQTGTIATGLTAGNYNVQVTDANGCLTSSFVSITQPPSLTAVVSSNNILCNGGSGGIATAIPSGGTGPYTYLWNTIPVQSGFQATGLNSGNYQVTITDNNGCIITGNAIVSEPPVIQLSTSSAATTCSLPNGQASVSATGGSGPFTYIWNCVPPQNGSIATGLLPGSYNVIVTDVNGCNATQGVIVTAKVPGIANASLVSSVTCFGGNNGSAIVNVSGGASPFTYFWNTTPPQTGQLVSGLTSGSYSAFVTDADGCLLTATVQIGQPPQLIASPGMISSVSCAGGNNGVASINISGGTSPFSINWNTNPAQTTPVASSLQAGIYTATVTDAQGCQATGQVNITAPLPITGTVTVSNATCFGNADGSASIAHSGGTPPYSYLWNSTPPQYTPSVAGLPAGNYQVTVMDSAGCNANFNALVLQPGTITLVTNTVAATCGLNNGQILVSPSGGTGPYTYAWNTSPVQTGPLAVNLAAGLFSVTVTDSNGCIQSVSTSLSSGTAGTLNVTAINHVSCFGGNDAVASANVTGGTPPFNFVWNTSPPQTGPIASNLNAGITLITSTDASGCVSNSSIMISEPPPLVISPVINNHVSCSGGNNGTVTASISGGTPGYSISWNTTPPQTNIMATGLSSGIYSATLTDAKGCFSNMQVNLTEPSPIAGIITKTDATCSGSFTGKATVSVSGGISPYNYTWNTVPVQNGNMAVGLLAGVRQVTVVDSNGCTAVISTTIEEPDSISIGITSVNSTCSSANGQATAFPAGGTPPYSINWSTSPIQTVATATNLMPGAYNVTITDSNSCSKIASVQIGDQPAGSVTILSSMDPTCYGGSDGSASIGIVGGTPPFTYFWNSTPSQTTSLASGLSAGNYQAFVTDYNGCVSSTTITLGQPAIMNVVVPAPGIICVGQPVILNPSATGGSGGYTYTWTPSGPVVAPTGTTTYTVVANDQSGCSSLPFLITVPVLPPLSIVTNNFVPVCEGDTVVLVASANGGDGNYQFNWNPGATSGPSLSIALQSSATYQVIVTDGCGSPATASNISVVVSPAPLIGFNLIPNEGCAPHEVVFTDFSTTPAGSNYQWTFGDNQSSALTNPVHTYFQPGIYPVTLTITNPSGCSASYSNPVPVTVHAMPEALFTMNNENPSMLSPLVQFSNLSTNSTSWLWTFGNPGSISSQQNPSYAFPNPGVYQVILTAMNQIGCMDTFSRMVTVDDIFTLYIPNAFTPDNDGKNDFFTIGSTGVSWAEVKIYDRWGRHITTTHNLERAWDGKEPKTGALYPSSVFLYMVTVKDLTGRQRIYNGRVSLVR